MGESLLRKEFKKSDVERVRSLVKGNYGDSTQTVIGFQKKSERVEHKEGDVWEDSNGKKWTIEDGIRVAVSKLELSRKLSNIPLLCPKCGKSLNTRLDKKVFPIHGFCYDCLVKFEDDLKRAGLYKEYEKQMLTKNIRSFVEDLKSRIKDMKDGTKVTVSAEDGTLESWGTASSVFVDGLESWAKLLTEQLD